jgi:hypothetical protein
MLSHGFFSVESMGPHGQRTAVIYLKERATPKKYPRLPGISHVPSWKASDVGNFLITEAERFHCLHPGTPSKMPLWKACYCWCRPFATAKIWKSQLIYFRGHQLEDVFVRSRVIVLPYNHVLPLPFWPTNLLVLLIIHLKRIGVSSSMIQ